MTTLAVLLVVFGLIIAVGLWAERRHRDLDGQPRSGRSDPLDDSAETARRAALHSGLFGGGQGPGPG